MIIKPNPKLIIGFGAGLAQALGLSTGLEMYRMFKAIDPLYETRVKLAESKNKKRFDHIMSQTDLKADLA